MKTRKIALIGGPSTGKTTLINALRSDGYYCMEEISRQVTIDAQKKGIDQLFLEDPLLFSQQLLIGRQNQFNQADSLKQDLVFFDRGLPDVIAYLDYLGSSYPDNFKKVCGQSKYDYVFILNPWKAIYKQDNERYETFEQSLIINEYLVRSYTKFGYTPIDIPFGTVKDRIDFIVNYLSKQV